MLRLVAFDKLWRLSIEQDSVNWWLEFLCVEMSFLKD